MIGTIRPRRPRLAIVGVLILSAAWSASGQTPRAELLGHSDRVEALAFSSDGRRLASGGFDGVLALWDVRAGELGSFDSPNGPVRALLATRSPIQTIAFAPDPPADPLHLGPRHRPVPSRLVTLGEDGSATLWDANAGVILTRLPLGARPVVSISFDAQGRMLATSARDGSRGARLFEVATGIDRSTYGDYVELPRSIAFSPDGKRLAVGDFNGRISVMEHRSGGWTIRHVIQGHNDTVWATAFSGDARRLATGGGLGRVGLWDAETGRPLATIPAAHPGGVRSLAFAPGDATLATGGIDGVVRLWDVADLIKVGITPPPPDALRPDPARIETENEP